MKIPLNCSCFKKRERETKHLAPPKNMNNIKSFSLHSTPYTLHHGEAV